MHMYNTHSEEERRPKCKSKTFMFKFSHLAIKYEFHFSSFGIKIIAITKKIGIQILAAAHLQIHDYLGKVMFFPTLSLLISKRAGGLRVLNLAISGRTR